MIAKTDLEHGAYYAGRCRNATVARWDAHRQQFRHWRTKFGASYLEYISHPDDESRYDVFTPAARIEPVEPPIALEETQPRRKEENQC